MVLTAHCAGAPAAPVAPVPKTDEARTPAVEPTSFADDVAFLSQHTELLVLESAAGARVAVAAEYQGRVMTSAVSATGRSLGYINRSFIEGGARGTQFDNYGGEDRFWLGPEGGQYSLYFAPEQAFSFANWQTPHALQEGAWQARDASSSGVTFSKELSLTNYARTEFRVGVERRIQLLTREQATERLGIVLGPTLEWVGFSSTNVITNLGAVPWTPEQGLPSVWILGMFSPAADARVIIPFETAASGEIVNDRYFGKVPQERLVVHAGEGYLVFSCDGQYRSKIGLGPSRAKPVLGSYSEHAGLLTLVAYSQGPRAARYVNSLWELQTEPYAGDVVNSYNDGPTEPGKPSLGGFYEIESSSPAAELAPGQTLSHVHETFHFSGSRAELEPLARAALGVSLDAL